MGGWIAEAFNWRVAFLCKLVSCTAFRSGTLTPSTGQVPLLCIAFVLIFLKVHYVVPGQGKSKREMLGRIDYAGSLALIGAVRRSDSFLFDLH